MADDEVIHSKDAFDSESIRNIERLGGQYDPNSQLTLQDQLDICEIVEKRTSKTDYRDGDGNVNGNGNGTCKNGENSSETFDKREVIDKLRGCSYRTPPIEVAGLLEIFFSSNPSRPGWWLTVAQRWTPRTINRVIAQMIKKHRRGDVTIQNPSAYFTDTIKFRARRKITRTIGTRKQRDSLRGGGVST